MNRIIAPKAQAPRIEPRIVKTSDQILSWASDEDDDVVAEADTVDDRDRVVVEMVGDVAL